MVRDFKDTDLSVPARKPKMAVCGGNSGGSVSVEKNTLS